MTVNSHGIEADARDQCFFMDFGFACGDKGDYKD